MKFLITSSNRMSLSGLIFLGELIIDKNSDIDASLVCENAYGESSKIKIYNTSGERYKGSKIGHIKHDTTSCYNKHGKRVFLQTLHFINFFLKCITWHKTANKIMKIEKPDAIITSDDRTVGVNLAILRYAKKNSIPIFKVSVAEQMDYRREGFGSRYFDCELITQKGKFDINNIQRIISPTMILSYNEEKRTFYPTYCTIALWLHNMLPRHPWVCGASYSDLVYAYSEDEKTLILNENKDIKVLEAGLVEDNYLLSTVKNKEQIITVLRTKYRIDELSKIVLLSMPQLAEHNLVSWNIHKQNMKELVNCICSKYNNCLISLHPKSRREDYEFLENDKVRIINERLRDVIAAANVFICLDSSSTRHFASLLNIPGWDLFTNMFLSQIDHDKGLEELGKKRKQGIVSNNEIDLVEDIINRVRMASVLRGSKHEKN